MTIAIVAVAAALAWWLWEKSRRKTHPVPACLRADITLPHVQEFELYHNSLSLCSMKSRICLAELGIQYASRHIDLIETGAYENIRPALLAVNPAGTVPVLVHEGHPIYESHEQIRYAAGHAPPDSPRLVPDDPALAAEMQRWIDRSSITDDPLEHGDESAGNAVPGLTVPIFAAMIDRIAFWKILEGLLFHIDRRRPVVFLVLKLRGLAGLAKLRPVVAVIRRSHRQMGEHLDALEAQLRDGGGPWILGEAYSLADVSWSVIFERLAQVDCEHVHLREDLRPECAAYWARLKSRPSYRAAILEHPHPTIAYGTNRLREAKAADPALRAALEGSGSS
ncbi:MAG: glutathione S-transferase family protein [bacterium]|nr:glutathione S-transferase family protein [bacterium]